MIESAVEEIGGETNDMGAGEQEATAEPLLACNLLLCICGVFFFPIRLFVTIHT